MVGLGGLTTGAGGGGIFGDSSLSRVFTPIGVIGSCNAGISGILIELGLIGAIGIPTICSVFLFVCIGGGGGKSITSGLPTETAGGVDIGAMAAGTTGGTTAAAGTDGIFIV